MNITKVKKLSALSPILFSIDNNYDTVADFYGKYVSARLDLTKVSSELQQTVAHVLSPKSRN